MKISRLTRGLSSGGFVGCHCGLLTMLFRSTFYLWIWLHFKDTDWSLTTFLLGEVYYYLHLISRETEAEQKEVLCSGPQSALVKERGDLGLDSSSLDGLGVPLIFIFSAPAGLFSCSPPQPWVVRSPGGCEGCAEPGSDHSKTSSNPACSFRAVLSM